MPIIFDKTNTHPCVCKGEKCRWTPSNLEITGECQGAQLEVNGSITGDGNATIRGRDIILHTYYGGITVGALLNKLEEMDKKMEETDHVMAALSHHPDIGYIMGKAKENFYEKAKQEVLTCTRGKDGRNYWFKNGKRVRNSEGINS